MAQLTYEQLIPQTTFENAFLMDSIECLANNGLKKLLYHNFRVWSSYVEILKNTPEKTEKIEEIKSYIASAGARDYYINC